MTASTQALAVGEGVAPTVGYLDDVVRFGGVLSASVGVVLAALASALWVTLQDEPTHRGREALAVAPSPLSAGHGRSYWVPQRPRLLAIRTSPGTRRMALLRSASAIQVERVHVAVHGG